MKLDLGECRSPVNAVKECMTGICTAVNPINDTLRMPEYVGGRRIGIVTVQVVRGYKGKEK